MLRVDLAILGVSDVQDVLPDQFVAAVAEQGAKGVVDQADPALGVALHDANGDVVEHAAEVCLASAQGLLRLLPVGDVAADGEDLHHLAVFVEHRPVGPGHPDLAAIAADVLVHVVRVALGVGDDLLGERAQPPAGALDRRNQQAQVLAKHRIGGIAKKRLGVLVEEGDGAVALPADDSAVGILDQLAVAVLAAPQCLGAGRQLLVGEGEFLVLHLQLFVGDLQLFGLCLQALVGRQERGFARLVAGHVAHEAKHQRLSLARAGEAANLHRHVPAVLTNQRGEARLSRAGGRRLRRHGRGVCGLQVTQGEVAQLLGGVAEHPADRRVSRDEGPRTRLAWQRLQQDALAGRRKQQSTQALAVTRGGAANQSRRGVLLHHFPRRLRDRRGILSRARRLWHKEPTANKKSPAGVTGRRARGGSGIPLLIPHP